MLALPSRVHAAGESSHVRLRAVCCTDPRRRLLHRALHARMHVAVPALPHSAGRPRDAKGRLQVFAEPASNRAYNPVQVSNIACIPGQRIVQGTDEAAYLAFSCQDCGVPVGMNASALNATWTWEAGCAWNCADGLMKYEFLGTYRCGTYLQKILNATAGTLTVDWSWANVNALLGSLLIIVLFVFCLLSRLLASKEEDEVDEEQTVQTDVEKSVKEGEL